MTEADVRKRFADCILGLVGKSDSHDWVIALYNSQSPLPRGHRLTKSDAWCAATVAAAAVATGLTSIIPMECSCNKIIEIARSRGIWVENDAYVPSAGDLVLYDWQDGADYASTDNKAKADHIGTVYDVKDGYSYVVEGNMSGKVGKRKLKINGRYIRGFVTPKYSLYVEENNKKEDEEMTREEILEKLGDRFINTFDELPAWAKPDVRELLDAEIINGGTSAAENPDDINMLLSDIRVLIAMRRMLCKTS